MYDVMEGTGNCKLRLEVCVMLSGQTARITQPSTGAYSKFIISLATYNYMLVTQELQTSVIIRRTSQSCCFTSPPRTIECDGVLVGYHTPGLRVGHTGTIKLENIRLTSQSCCFTSPPKS